MNINGAILNYGRPFKDIVLIMSKCDDIVRIKKTYNDSSLIDITSGTGNDTIEIGVEGGGMENRIYSNLIVDAGDGTDYLLIHDDGSTTSKDIDVRFNLMRGFDGVDSKGNSSSTNTSSGTEIFLFGVEQISMNLGPFDNVVNIASTPTDSTLNVTSQGGADFIHVISTQGSLILHTGSGNDNVTVDAMASHTSLLIDSGADNDSIQIYGLGYKGNATILGGDGEDKLYVDSRSSEEGVLRNKMNGTTLSWNGGDGADELVMYFVSTGSSNLNIIGDNSEGNEVILHCPDIACTVLSRDTFIANIHDPGNLDGSLERLNLDNSAIISSLILKLHEGNNR